MRPKKPITFQTELGRLGREIYIKAKHQGEFHRSKLGSPEFERAASELIARKVILSQIERVLIIPQNDQKSCSSFYFIFGYGDALQNDLYIYWNSETKQIKCLPFRIDGTKKETLSTLETFKLWNMPQKEYLPFLDSEGERQGGVPPWDDKGKRKIYLAHIEEIKRALKARKIETVSKLANKEQFDFVCLEKSPSLKYVSVILSRFKNASFVLLRDVFDPRYNTKLESKISLPIDPFSPVREFLKHIDVYAERRGGSPNRPGRLKTDDEKELIKKVISVCKSENIKKPSKALIEKEWELEGMEKPLTSNKLKNIQSKVSKRLAKQ